MSAIEEMLKERAGDFEPDFATKARIDYDERHQRNLEIFKASFLEMLLDKRKHRLIDNVANPIYLLSEIGNFSATIALEVADELTKLGKKTNFCPSAQSPYLVLYW